MKSICKVRSRLEGFLGRFFLVQLVFWLQALSGPGVHGGTGHHEASWGLMAAQDITRLHEASRRHRASRRLSRPHEASWRRRASRRLSRPHEASWHPQGLLSGPASTVRHWSFALRPRTLARGLKGFCGFCADSAVLAIAPPYSSPERPTGIHWRQERLHPQRESGAIRSQRTGESADDAAAPAQTCA